VAIPFLATVHGSAADGSIQEVRTVFPLVLFLSFPPVLRLPHTVAAALVMSLVAYFGALSVIGGYVQEGER